MKAKWMMLTAILALCGIAQAQERVVLLAEDFEGLPLGTSIEESAGSPDVWTDTPPEGWFVDENGVPGIGDLATDGMTEWAGWAFADKDWWTQVAGDQRRSEYVLGQGTVAIADPDEWDDAGHTGNADNPYDTWMSMRPIDLSATRPGTVKLQFDSSWRPEYDDWYRQSASITVSYDSGDPVEILRWVSQSSSPYYKDDSSTNETIVLDIDNPADAASMVVTFGMFDAGNDWWWAIDNILVTGARLPEKAVNHSPRNKTVEVPAKTHLSWTAGAYVGGLSPRHRILLSSDLTAVEDGSAVVATQDANSLDTTGLLDFDTTYYWRVDEANRVSTWDLGGIFQFATEQLAYPIASDRVTVTASGAMPGMDPQNTINGAGLNKLDQHDADPMTMWLSMDADKWIQYEFDKPTKLHEMLVWNSNQAIETFIGFGIKEITVEHSVDGENWTALNSVQTLAQATGTATYTANTAVDLSGITAKYVKLSEVSAYGTIGQSGLAEVRFMAIPVCAREPQPAEGTTSAGAAVPLMWKAGREAVSHQVFLGTDPANLIQIATTTDPMTVTDALEYGTTYYWSVTEVNESAAPTTYAGDVWSFTTPDYGTVDDFESYSGLEGEEVFLTWLDGFGVDPALGGSTTGHFMGPFVENTIVNSGSQSLPFHYDNDGGFVDIDGSVSAPTHSEIVCEFAAPQDWTASGVKALVIWFQGTEESTGQLYCKINDTKLSFNGNVDFPIWQPFVIDLTALNGMQSVRSLTLGVEGSHSAGLLYVDDILLMVTPPAPVNE